MGGRSRRHWISQHSHSHHGPVQLKAQCSANGREAFGEVVEYGAGKNVVINLENDDLVSEDAFFLW